MTLVTFLEGDCDQLPRSGHTTFNSRRKAADVEGSGLMLREELAAAVMFGTLYVSL